MARDNKASDKDEGSDIIDKLVAVNRVAKVVKGGKRFGFAALVVVGDGKGKVGYGSGKAKEVSDAVKKATEDAKKHMIRIALREGRTLHHDIAGRFGAGKVYLRSAAPGTGIIAGGPMRAVCEATFAALTSMRSPRAIAAKRGKKVGEIIGRREATSDGKEKAEDAKE
jgi:small subunit ribosomal protein S5